VPKQDSAQEPRQRRAFAANSVDEFESRHGVLPEINIAVPLSFASHGTHRVGHSCLHHSNYCRRSEQLPGGFPCRTNIVRSSRNDSSVLQTI
jgi:hypothetical protein